MFKLSFIKTVLLSVTMTMSGLSCATANSQESEVEMLINSAQNSLPLRQYSEHRDAVMEISCGGQDWTLAWSERSGQLTGKVNLKNGLKSYDVTEIETAIFQNFSGINTPIIICADRDETGSSYPTQIFITGTEAKSSNFKSIEVSFDELAETPVAIRILQADSVSNYSKRKISQFDNLSYDVTLDCNGYKWHLEWKKNALKSTGTIRVDYKNQHVKYDPIGKSIFDNFLQMDTPSLLCSTPRDPHKSVTENVSSQLRLGGLATSKETRARSVITAYISQGLLVLNARDLTK